jgi:hypothetical protein
VTHIVVQTSELLSVTPGVGSILAVSVDTNDVAVTKTLVLVVTIVPSVEDTKDVDITGNLKPGVVGDVSMSLDGLGAEVWDRKDVTVQEI